jgi:hypothetical protein
MTTFNYAFFKENFKIFRQHWDCGSNHPEYAYTNFYHEFVRGDEDNLFTDEDKSFWKSEWIDLLGLEDEQAELTFEELIEEYESPAEDLTGDIIDSDEPKFSELKEKFIAQLFLVISEEWTEDQIKDAIA